MITTDTRPIEVDVPVRLERGDVVLNIGRLAFTGDLPFGLKYLAQLSKALVDGRIIGVFHGPAAYLVLNDEAYNKTRQATSGNPHREMVAELVKRRAQLEICAVSMQSHNWTRDDLLPDIRITTSALLRIIELAQRGFVQIQP
jgi:intracellular sulfur oxidation DsrE/DsrF family protein